jgi:FkbM family methyltransferase
MPPISLLRGIGNRVYEHAFPFYRVCYRTFKAYADRAERQLLKRILSAGDVVVDAGANIGIYSQFLARCVSATGMVHSFEPSPDNFKRLQSATRKLANVRLSQAAVGEISGRARLYLSDKLNVDHRTYTTHGDSRHTVPIEIIALDDYFKPGQRVDVIKMDIQGYELHALRGASRVLADNPDLKLLVEFWPYGLKQAGASWVELLDTLRTKNMLVTEITNRGLVPFCADSVRETSEWYVNLFAASKQHGTSLAYTVGFHILILASCYSRFLSNTKRPRRSTTL